VLASSLAHYILESARCGGNGALAWLDLGCPSKRPFVFSALVSRGFRKIQPGAEFWPRQLNFQIRVHARG
jgi:hypothetical protein